MAAARFGFLEWHTPTGSVPDLSVCRSIYVYRSFLSPKRASARERERESRHRERERGRERQREKELTQTKGEEGMLASRMLGSGFDILVSDRRNPRNLVFGLGAAGDAGSFGEQRGIGLSAFAGSQELFLMKQQEAVRERMLTEAGNILQQRKNEGATHRDIGILGGVISEILAICNREP